MSATAPVMESARAGEPLSAGQRALWFVTQLAPSNPVYNVVGAARFPVSVNPTAFAHAARRISERHAVLRSTFEDFHGEPRQRVHASLEPELDYVDARTWSEAGFREHVLAVCRRPFDLENGPPVRTVLYARSREEYVGLTVLHHLVSDLWSIALYVRELDAFYGAYTGGAKARLAEPAATYRDFVEAERRFVASAEGEDAWEYWRRRLSGSLPRMNLPADFERPAAQSFRGGVISLPLSLALARRLAEIAKDTQSSLSTLCLSAFQVLLHRYCREDDIIVGFPRANRQARFSGVFGYFVNAVSLRADLSGNPSFLSFLSRNTSDIAADLAHGQLPFPVIAERLKVAQDRSRAPVWQAAFTWQKTTRGVSADIARFAAARAGGAMPFHHLPMESIDVDAGVAQFDLALQMGGLDERAGEGATPPPMTLTYSKDLFAPGTAQRMLDSFAALLESIAENPQARLSELRILSERERRLIARECAHASVPVVETAALEDAIAAHAIATPAKPAVVCGDGVLSYAELEQQAEALSLDLRRRGVGPEVRVAVCAERGPGMIVAVLAVLKAGGAFVPLDPAAPAGRIEFILQDAGVHLVLASSSLKAKLGSFAGPFLLLDAAPAAAEPGAPPARHAPAAGQLAYVIYTSGSTGRPKGVGVARGEFARHCRAMAWQYRITAADRILQFASLCFDASLEQIFTALVRGATLHLRPGTIWKPWEFHSLLLERKLSVINLPPAYWDEWVQEWSRKRWPAPNSLRLAIIGGDAIPPETVRLWQAAVGSSVRLLNAYGPTETTITALIHEMAPGKEDDTRVPIGRVLPLRCAYVLDEAGQPVPFGVAGELCLGGAGLARGYLGHPEITAEKFLPDPHSPAAGGRLYRTGDLARLRSDGVIEYLGRLDRQVKLRGFRIELEEIEQVLARHPKVRRAAVAMLDSASGKRLCAYVVAEPAGAGLKRELRSFLFRKLPDYMVPSAFVLLDALPLSAGGKVDRQALPAPEPDQDDALGSEPPRTEVEAVLAGIWKEVLGVDGVGIQDNFFELGGHSLAATRVVSRLRDEFGVDLALARFFENPTIAGLSLALAEASLASLPAGEAETLLKVVERNG